MSKIDNNANDVVDYTIVFVDIDDNNRALQPWKDIWDTKEGHTQEEHCSET